MSESPATVLADSSKQLALRLLRRRPFSAGYLTQVIDLAVRKVVRSQFDEPDEGEAALVHQRLTRYAANGQPGSTELARAMLDVKHALDLVRHGHYRASAVPESGLDTTVSAERLLELVTEAGRDRVLAAQGEHWSSSRRTRRPAPSTVRCRPSRRMPCEGPRAARRKRRSAFTGVLLRCCARMCAWLTGARTTGTE